MSAHESTEERRSRLEKDKRVRRVSRAVRKALDEALVIARGEGCPNPKIFFESDGSIHVMDLDHPGETTLRDVSCGERQKAIVFTLPDLTPPRSDVGAW